MTTSNRVFELRFPTPLRCVPLISGGGRTVFNLLQKAAAGELAIEIPLVIADRPCTGIERLRAQGIPVELFARGQFPSTAARNAAIFQRIRQSECDLVLLAGYLSRVTVPADFENRVLNIHPALIPAFCGHGMYGDHVHAAVINRGCRISGCTVHFCDNEYDHGPIVLQQTVPVLDGDDPHTLAARVFTAECEAFPAALQLLMSGPIQIVGQRVLCRT